MSQAIEQTQSAQATTEQAQEQQSAPDISQAFADDFTEEMMRGAFEQDKDTGEQTAQIADGQESEQPKQEQTEQKPEEAKPDEDDGKYLISMFGKDVELEGDQLVELVEAGAQLIQHRPQVERAMKLLNAVDSDPKLLAVLTAYANGQQLPSDAPQQAQELAMPGTAISQFKEQVRQEIIAEIEERYKPFVDNVNSFAAEQMRDKAFSKYRADPEYATVNEMMTRNIAENVTQGHITHEDAANIDKILKINPKIYGEWFEKFKQAGLQARSASTVVTQPQTAARSVQRAPLLEASGGAPEMANESIKQRWDGGDRAGAFAATLMQNLK